MARQFPGFTSNLYHAVVRWGVRCVWAIIVVAFALVQTHVITEITHEASAYVVIVVTLLLFLSEMMNEWRRDMFDHLQTQSHTLDSLLQNIRGGAQLLSLEESFADLKERLAKIDVGAKVDIDHFAADMTFAWDPVYELIRDASNLTDIEYRLLILSPNPTGVAQFDDEVKTWLQTGATQVAKIKKETEALQAACLKAHRTFSFELRTYATFPAVHGLRVTAPFHAAYIAFCRFDRDDPTKFRWGRNAYHASSTVHSAVHSPISLMCLSEIFRIFGKSHLYPR